MPRGFSTPNFEFETADSFPLTQRIRPDGLTLGGGANPSVARVSKGVARAKYGDPVGSHSAFDLKSHQRSVPGYIYPFARTPAHC